MRGDRVKADRALRPRHDAVASKTDTCCAQVSGGDSQCRGGGRGNGGGHIVYTCRLRIGRAYTYCFTSACSPCCRTAAHGLARALDAPCASFAPCAQIQGFLKAAGGLLGFAFEKADAKVRGSVT